MLALDYALCLEESKFDEFIEKSKNKLSSMKKSNFMEKNPDFCRIINDKSLKD